MANVSACHVGYRSAAYASSLQHIGQPLRQPQGGGYFLERVIPQTSYRDLVGPYPLFSCNNWPGLSRDLGSLEFSHVTATAVIDPMAGCSLRTLKELFPHHLIEFKHHHVIDLRLPAHSGTHSDHRRKASKALRSVEVELCPHPRVHADTWVKLYDSLIQRHDIRGVARFSEDSFAAQLCLTDLNAWCARHNGEVVSMLLFIKQEDVVYYHLGAHSKVGYELQSSFALFHEAIAHYASQGLQWMNLGAGAGTTVFENDGLSRFKRGWATDTRVAYLAGRVLNKDHFRNLVASSQTTSFFPPYRATL